MSLKEKLTRFLESFTEKVPVEYAALLHIPTRTVVAFTISAVISNEYFEENFDKFIELVELSEQLTVVEAIGELQGTVLRGSSGFKIVAKLSENVILVCGGSDVGSLGLTLLKIVELKDLIRRREGKRRAKTPGARADSP